MEMRQIFKIVGCCLIGMVCLSVDFEKKENWAETTLANMTLDEKIGQLFIVTAISDPDLLSPNFEPFFESAIKHGGLDCKWKEYGNKAYIEELITNYYVGGVIYLGKARAVSQIKLTNSFRSISKYPLFIAQDCEWGLNHRLEDVIRFPQSMTLGALTNDALIYDMGREIGEECLSVGININFAPCVDVNVNYKNPVINMRSFGDDKNKVALKAIAYMKGMQDVGLISCAKHFPGHGDTYLDSHYDLPRIDKTAAELHDVELYPFKKMVEAGVDSIMTAHLEVPAFEIQPKVPSSLSHAIVTHLLRKKLGFKGLIITDALIMQGVTSLNKAGEIELKALLAGNDILLCPTNVPEAVKIIKDAVFNGVLSEQELNEHVLRILYAKEKVMHQGRFKSDIGEDLSRLETVEALNLKKQLFTHAITFCGNASDLPLSGTDLALIEIGSKGDLIFKTNLEENFHLINHFDIREDFDEKVREEVVEKVKNCESIALALYNIDAADHQTYGINPQIFQLINDLNSQGKLILITLFGTPYSLKLFRKEQSIIVAYQNDSDAIKAAVDVFCGHCKASGQLPVADRRYIEQQ